MADTKSAKKQARASEKRRIANKSVRSLARSRIRTAEELIGGAELDGAKKAVVAAVSALDQAAEKGIIHPSNASRRKSRLMKKLGSALAPP